MKPRARFVVAASVVLALVVAQAAHASLENRGEELFQEGVRLASDGNYQSALEHFERAMAYTPRLNVLWNIACCHVVLGNRDLAVVCLDRYMEHDLAFQESAEMQAAVAGVEDEPADMPDVRRRGQLWDRIAAASQAVEKGEATAAPAEMRLYGTGSRSVRYKTGGDRSSPEGQRGRELNNQAIELYRDRGPEEALPTMERVLAYIADHISYHNMAQIHLKLGHRDLALAFLDLFQQRLPRLLESDAFQGLMSDLADAPFAMDAATAQGFVDRLDPACEWALSPTTPMVRTDSEDGP
jgi:tetratricopeptide (TPR) repeat protein